MTYSCLGLILTSPANWDGTYIMILTRRRCIYDTSNYTWVSVLVIYIIQLAENTYIEYSSTDHIYTVRPYCLIIHKRQNSPYHMHMHDQGQELIPTGYILHTTPYTYIIYQVHIYYSYPTIQPSIAGIMMYPNVIYTKYPRTSQGYDCWNTIYYQSVGMHSKISTYHS